jgi:hypothetical protein
MGKIISIFDKYFVFIALVIIIGLFLLSSRKKVHETEGNNMYKQIGKNDIESDDIHQDTPAQAKLRAKYRPLLENAQNINQAKEILYEFCIDGLKSGM